ncbi:MAG: hypothetical protein IPJ65_20545 [Archangiaceae bacterium]|nr:hypothetical protein [Archangiaceae bacterium]
MLRPLALLLTLAACSAPSPPPTRETLVLTGTARERGLQHGQQLASKIRSFYTTLLTSSLFPYLGREQPDIATLLTEYQKDRYQNGQFAYQMLLDSAHSLERSLSRDVIDELQGIAEGSGLTYDEVLVLNTFVDSTLAVRGIALAIRLSRAPVLERLELVGLEGDGVDNDGDGLVDEPGEAVLAPFSASRDATFIEVPTHFTVKVQLRDADGVDPALVRMQISGVPLTVTTAALADDLLEATAEVNVAPASSLLLVVSAGDRKILSAPAPDHASFMRDTEVLFTTRGANLAPGAVSWPTLTDGRTRPPSFAIALAGPATKGRAPLLAHSFALLDANTAHKHTAVFVHVPDKGSPFAVVGWAGVAWGLSGLNARGLGYACNPSDTLDNSVVGAVLENVLDLSQAKLTARGRPLGFAMRQLLQDESDTASALDGLRNGRQNPYGWSCALADAAGDLRAVELDSDIFKEGEGGIYEYGPADRLSSRGDGDLVLGSDYAKNQNDIKRLMVAGQRVVPQREWAGSFFRSRRVTSYVADHVQQQYGQLDVETVEQLISDPIVVDQSDSMNAVVLDLKRRTVWSAIGTEPAPDAGFEAVVVPAP